MMKLSIPDHPFYPNEGIVPDAALLDALVAAYERELDGGAPDPMAFLASSAPLRIFGRIFAQDPQELPARSFTWLLYLSGYFGGGWLRAQIQNAQLESMRVMQALPPTRKAFDAIVSRALGGRGVVHRADEDVLGYCEGILPELVEGFGYCEGLLLQMLEVPPEGICAPSGVLIASGRPLWCGHGHPRLEALADLYDVSSKLLQSHDPRWNRLLEWIPQAEQPEVERGRIVCRTSFSLRGWSKQAYEQLISRMGVFVEVSQATALTTVRAVAEGDPYTGRRACVAHSCLMAWRDAFAIGLFDSRFDGEAEPTLPRFSDRPAGGEPARAEPR